uniref:Uncharacterized protein n=1 Tax=Aegilops tauschii subsp. strangulata TaxID=200361 RepID=A0A453HE18_AEGTS
MQLEVCTEFIRAEGFLVSPLHGMYSADCSVCLIDSQLFFTIKPVRYSQPEDLIDVFDEISKLYLIARV